MPLPMASIGEQIGGAVGYALGRAMASALREPLSERMLAREYHGYIFLDFVSNLETVDPLSHAASSLLTYPTTAKLIVGAELFPEVHAIGSHKIIRLVESNRRHVLILIPEKMNYDAIYNGLKIPCLPDYLDLITSNSPA